MIQLQDHVQRETTLHDHGFSRPHMHWQKTGLSRVSAFQSVWGWLRAQEPLLPEQLMAQTGRHVGDVLITHWWATSDRQQFALQILNTEACSQWEVFCVTLAGDRPVIGCHRTWTKDREDGEATDILAGLPDRLKPMAAEVCQAHRHPTFLDIALAGAANAQLTCTTVEAKVLADVQADRDYWRSLAKEAVRVNERRTNEFRPVPQQDVASHTDAQQEGVVSRRWALKDMGEWAALNSERITVLPRAIAEAKKSNYEDEAFVFECLELLANEYTGTKRGELGRTAFKDRADEMGLSYGGSVEPSVAGSYASHYHIRWRGRRRFLDQHLTRGNVRNTRYCMRIYFTWDEQDQKVVVGWLPSHLATSGS